MNRRKMQRTNELKSKAMQNKKEKENINIQENIEVKSYVNGNGENYY